LDRSPKVRPWSCEFLAGVSLSFPSYEVGLADQMSVSLERGEQVAR
jgi:hypothetical protein